MAINAAPQPSRSSGRIPADWEASTIRGTPCSRHRAAIGPTGWIKPNTLETWLQITASTPAVISRWNASYTPPASNSGPAATRIFTPGMA